MPGDLTTAQAAELLTQRGVTAKDGGPVRRESVTQWCQRGLFVGAWHGLDRERGEWYIPEASVEAFAATERRAGRKKGNRDV